MTDKRLLRALAGEPVDRPPFWFMRQAGRYLPEYRATREQAGDFLELCYNPELAEEVTLQPIRRFGMDAAILFADILLLPQALGREVAFRAGEGPVLEPLTRNEDIPEMNAGRLHDHLGPVYETVGRLSNSLPDDVALIGFAGAPWTVATYMVEGGSSKDYAATKGWAFADREGFGRLIDVLTQATGAYLKQQIRAGAEVVQIFDTWAGALPAAWLEPLVFAPLRRIAADIHESFPDVPVIGFPRGIGAAAERAAEIEGLAGLSVDWATDPRWAAERLQPHLTVQGNLDPRLVVVGGEPMRAAARDILRALAKGPFIFNLGHGIVPETPPEHVGELSDLVRNWKAE
ncbi:MAG: uroporphyrinogen decarboxylase [Rhizobiales bacterium NRL2]|mgnify:CR=1 FL=1|jgi:uroporphyrinogen decarboxylase|nr:MAG: uroporphyrinogen decarboxylase [Rhizobiales bacterium NRL2]